MKIKNLIIKAQIKMGRLRFRPLSPLVLRSFSAGGSPPLSVSLSLRLLFFLLTSIFSLLPSTLFPTILTVKQDGTGDFTIIQEAYLAASSGDTVIVWPGTYYENLAMTDEFKDITIASLYLTTQDESYIHNTIIDGNKNGSCIALINTGQAVITINGFTFMNGCGYGNGQRGGGIYIDNSSPSITKNIIIHNNAKIGGGIAVTNSNLFLSGNTIKYNFAYNGGGGLFNMYDSQIYFDDDIKNSIYLNSSSFGSDIAKSSYSPEMFIVLDTFTVTNPVQHFIYSFDVNNFPLNDLTISIENAKVEPVKQDLYVNPYAGSNLNDGLTPSTALKTIAYAYHIISSDSLNPHSIFLSNGVYSPSTNGELFPLNGRCYVSLIGENRDSTIFDADSLYYFFKGYGLMESFEIKNITFQNGFGNVTYYDYSGLCVEICSNVLLDNLYIHNCSSSLTPGIYCSKSSNMKFTNLWLKDNRGGQNFQIGNSFEPQKTFEINNCKIIDAKPDSDLEVGEGFGMGIFGNLIEPGRLIGKIINLQITDNLRIPDPGWGSGMAGGLIINNHATVDLINATIGNNVVRGEQGFAVNVDEGSELNIYNSILFGDSLRELSLGNNPGSDFPATASIAYSNIEGGEQEIKNWYNQHTLNWLDGNIDKDPRWAGTGDTAYYLLNDSPCINAGTPMYEEWMDYPYIKIEDEKIVLYKYDGDTIHLPATDLAGNPRISGGRIDMGAYEFQDTTTSVKEFAGYKEDDNKVLVYPNPFTAHTFISFRLYNPGKVVVKISDINGRHLRTLMDAKTSRGEFTMTWEGTDDYGGVVRTGTYIVNFFVNGIKMADKKIVKR